MDTDPEIKAMTEIYALLKNLEPDAQGRALTWVTGRLGITAPHKSKSAAQNEADDSDGVKPSGDQKSIEAYDSIADVLAKSSAKTHSHKALLVAAFLQKKDGKDDLTSQEINKELFHMGHKVPNITAAMADLIGTRPQLMVQTRKDGSTKQARKKYKVTTEGFAQVERLLTTPDTASSE